MSDGFPASPVGDQVALIIGSHDSEPQLRRVMTFTSVEFSDMLQDAIAWLVGKQA